MKALKDFLAEFWLWILIPALLVGAGLAWLLMSGGSDSSNPFSYTLF